VKAGRCTYDRALGEPDTVGATLPGFRVATSNVPTEWGLEGEHLFSRFALMFRVIPEGNTRCRVRAETSAEFPGHQGVVYRALVVGSGGHVVAVRGMLRSIKTKAERMATSATG
jgi:hypothetical protein